jgi:hypothetical protein
MSGEGPKHVEAHEVARRPFRYFDFVMVAFVTVLLLSNVIGAGRSRPSTCPASVTGRSARESCFSRFPM